MEELNASGTPLVSPLFPFLASARFEVSLKLFSNVLKPPSFQRDLSIVIDYTLIIDFLTSERWGTPGWIRIC